MLTLVKVSTDVSVYVFIQDSRSAIGAGLIGLVYNSSGLVCYYVRPLAAAAALTLATQTVTGAHSDGGFVEVDATNMPGIYRLDLSDAVCATGVNFVKIMLKGAANMVPFMNDIQLTNFDLNSAANTQTGDSFARLGLAGAGLTDLGGMSTTMKASVNAEVVDALNVDTYAEPGQEAPPATTTLVKKLGYLYKFLRNRKTQTSTTLSVFADDATTVDQKATISDNGTTYDHGEVATGP